MFRYGISGMLDQVYRLATVNNLIIGRFYILVMDDKLLTRFDLARRWNVSIDTLIRRERTKILRPIRLDGRVIRYRMSDVLRIEAERYAGG